MDAAAIQRFARHIALPEIGLEGQERLAAARVAIAGNDMAAEVAARYLRAAGVGALHHIGGEHTPWPADGEAWLEALDRVHLVVRSGFDDDAMLGAAKRLGIPAVVVRAQADSVDLISFPKLEPAADANVDLPRAAGTPSHNGAAGVVAGTLAAAEAIHALLRPAGGQSGARMLRLPLDGRPPQGQEIPWR